MANGADPAAAATRLEAGQEDAEAGEHAKIVNKEHQEEEPLPKPAENGVDVHWGFGLLDLYRIALKFYKGTWPG